MLSQSDKDKLKLLGLDPEKLIAAVTAETETAITVPEGQFLTDEQLTQRDTVKQDEGKRSGVEEGKRAGFEIAHKTLIDKFGLKDVKKTDDTTKITEALSATLTAGDEGLKKQVNELLKDKEKLTEEKEAIIREKKQVEQKTQLLGMLPKNRTAVLSDDEFLTLLQSNIKEVDGVQVVELNGEILKDQKTRANMPLKEAIIQVFEARKWLDTSAAGGGRGGSDDNGGRSGGYRKYSEFEKDWIAKNGENSNLGSEFQAALAKEAASPDFKIDE